MGRFYTNVTLKGPDVLTVRRAVARMRRWAGVAEGSGGLVVVFDRESERQDGSGYPFVEELSRELACVALYVTNHDDSVLYYRLYDSGKVIDSYDSCPNYFEGPPAPPQGGDAGILCCTFGAPSARDRVCETLRYDPHAQASEGKRSYVWEVQRHADLVDALGLPRITVGFGYTYLVELPPDKWPEGLTPESCYAVEGEP